MPIFSSGPGLWRRIRLVLDPTAAAKLRADTQKALRDATNPNVANANLGLMGRGLAFLRGQALQVAAAMAAVFTARKVVEWIDSWRLIEGRLKLVTKDAEELRGVQEAIFDISQRTRASYEATSQLFQRTALSAAQLGKTTEDVLQLTETVQKAIRISGAGNQEATAGVIQLSQALASGVLRGDEFRSVMENLPGLARTIADGLGVTRGQLRALSAEGKLTAQEVVDAILKMKDAVDRDFADVPLTIGQSFTMLGNSLMRFFGQADEAAGASESLANSIANLARNIDKLSGSFAKVSGGIAFWLGQLREGAITILSPFIDLVLGAAGALARFNALAARVRGNKKLEEDFNRTADAIQRMRFELAERVKDNVLGGPVISDAAVQGMVAGFEAGLHQLEEKAKAARDRAARDTVRSARDEQLDAIEEMLARQTRAVAEARRQLQSEPMGDRRDLLRQQMTNAEAFIAKLKDVRGSVEAVGAAWVGLDNATALTAEELIKRENERIALLIEAHQLRIQTSAEHQELLDKTSEINRRLQDGNLSLSERVRLSGHLRDIWKQLLGEVSDRNVPLLAPGSEELERLQFQIELMKEGIAAAKDARRDAFRESQRPDLLGAGTALDPGRRAPGLRELGLPDPEEEERFKKGWMELHQGIIQATENAAFGFANAWKEAFDLMRGEGRSVGRFFKTLFSGMGASVMGFLAEIAGGKVKENVARAAEAVASGIAASVLYHDASAVARGAKAGAMHLAAAAAWGALGGAAASGQGAIAAGGGASGNSGGLPRGMVDPAGRFSDYLEQRGGDTFYLYVDGVDPRNPVHQEVVGKAAQGWDKRHGRRVTIKEWNGAAPTV